MDDAPLFALDHPEFFLLLNFKLNLALDGLLGLGDDGQLVVANLIVLGAGLLLVGQVVLDGGDEPLLEVDVELVLEGVPPVVLVGQEFHALDEVVGQEALGDVEALELAHGLDLLLALDLGVLEHFVLDLDAGDFALDLLLPLGVLDLAALVVVVLELFDLFMFKLFFDFKTSLVDGLAEQHVEDGLDFFVVVEEIVVFDLSDFVDARLLGNILWTGRFRLENIGLQFHICFVRLGLALLGQEVGEVHLDARWRPGSQVVRARR